MVVEPSLTKALAQFTSPLAFLDFETVSLAIPRWPGCRPWQQVPVQFSAHVERVGGLVHHQWIAEGPEDPRPALAEALVAVCTGARKVVAYHTSFERECIKRLREAAPHLDKDLERIEKRLVDLLPVIRRHVYHPDFGGGPRCGRRCCAIASGTRWRWSNCSRSSGVWWPISWSCFEGSCWSRLSQPHATPEIPKPRVSPERGVLGFAANRRRQIDIALLERSPQPGHRLLTLAEYDVLASEGDRWNESALRSRPQPLEGSGGPE